MVKHSSGAVVLGASGALGFIFGVGYADWQWAVEHAQVLAGLVAYPPDSPVAIAHAKIERTPPCSPPQPREKVRC